MKLTAIALLMLSTTSIGILLSERSRTRTEICKELLEFCDLLRVDVGFINTPLTKLINEFSFKYLDFLTIDNIADLNIINSPLSNEENREISAFLFSLGKSSPQSQIILIDSFRENVKLMIKKYSAAYAKNSKLYISLGFFCGALISLIAV